MNYLWWALVFFAGAAAGSFLNICICRLPAGRSVVYPPSHCPACGCNLRAVDLVPVFSYILLRGKCRCCGCRISPQYPAVELLTGLLFALAVAKYGLTLAALRALLLISIVIPAMVIDLRHRIIPDKLNLAGLLLGLPLIFESKEVLFSGLAGFLAGGGLLYLVAVVSRGGMGGGDVKLAAVMGLLLGWHFLLTALYLAFVLGSLAGLAMVAVRAARLKEPIPFGPYLAAGALAALLAGDKVISWYAKFLVM